MSLRTWLVNWRAELAAAAGITLTRQLLADQVGWDPATVLVTAGIAATFTLPRLRPVTLAWIEGHLRRRRWRGALACVLPDPLTPELLRTGADRYGEWAIARIAGGSTVTELTGRSEHLAAFLAVDQVRVERDRNTAAVAHLRALSTDPLAGPPTTWPWITATRTSLWNPIPVGTDENGQAVFVHLVEHNLLVGGEPGSGKSVAVSQLVAATALDPGATLYLLDGKLVELAAWRQVADGFAGTPIDEATTLLRSIQGQMDQRYQWLLDHQQRKLPQAPGSWWS